MPVRVVCCAESEKKKSRPEEKLFDPNIFFSPIFVFFFFVTFQTTAAGQLLVFGLRGGREVGGGREKTIRTPFETFEADGEIWRSASGHE